MTARSKKQRNRNARIKREKSKVKELARLKKTLGIKDVEEMMDTDIATPVDVPKKKGQKSTEEKLIEEEFIEEKTQQDRGQTIPVTHPITKKKHLYNTKTMRDQFGSHPVWYKPHKEKRKANKRRVNHKSNFWTGGFLQV